MAELTIEFDAATQSLSALNSAAYRLIGTATCQIAKQGGSYLCRLASGGQGDEEALRNQFVELVTDENVREHLHTRTEPVRNLILALAFGSLAEQSKDTP